MEYYKALNLTKEPFSNSPDPDMFINFPQYRDVLQQLEISIRLRRGINLVTGAVGTGKTTVCRQLIRHLSHDPKIQHILILDPGFNSPLNFLAAVLDLLTGKTDSHGHICHGSSGSEQALKEKIKTRLFNLGVDRDMTTVMVIDEGQKICRACLETLRELLNYETNHQKLLQVVIFAQKEFEPMIREMDNLADRISYRSAFSPLNFRETRALLRFRIEQAAAHGAGRHLPGFTLCGCWAVYRITRGYPRKIINLAHHVCLALIIRERSTAGPFLVHACAKKMFAAPKKWTRSFAPAVMGSACACLVFLFTFFAIPVKPTVPLPPVPKQHQMEKHMQAPLPRPPFQVPGNPAVPQLTAPMAPVSESFTVDRTVPQPSGPINHSLLGQVRIQKNETLSVMINSVYGRYETGYRDKVLQANKDIADPDLILPGDFICFPFIPGAQARWTPYRACLALDRHEGFKTAYDSIRDCRKKGLDTRILPLSDTHGKQVFAVVLDKVFSSVNAAKTYAANHREQVRGFKAVEVGRIIRDEIMLTQYGEINGR